VEDVTPRSKTPGSNVAYSATLQPICPKCAGQRQSLGRNWLCQDDRGTIFDVGAISALRFVAIGSQDQTRQLAHRDPPCKQMYPAATGKVV
jgi:hypothetical protein